MMSKYNFISICFIVFIFSYIGSTVDALVGNICTSATLNQITNVRTTGVTMKVSEKEWVPGSKISVGIDVGKNFIRNLVIWAETVDGEQPGTHVGHWSPISEHEYLEGCNGPAESTVSNQIDLNLSQINYEWNAPSETAVTPSPQPSQPSTPSLPQPNQPSTPSSQLPSQPSTPSSQLPSQPSTPSSPLPSQSSTPGGISTSPSPTHKPKKSKHRHHKHHKHHKNHKDHEDFSDFSELKDPLIDMITGKQNRLTRRDQTSVGSIIFKGVLQLMNHPDDEIYSFTSDVIAKSTSLTSTQNTAKNDTVLRVTEIDQNVPKEPSAAHSKFILKSHTFISILTLIVGFLTY